MHQLESRTTLLISAGGSTLISFLLALGLNTHSQPLSGAAVIGFVVSFSFGLAPVAWVVLSEVVPQEARTAVGSVGVGVNWATNLALVSGISCALGCICTSQRGLRHKVLGEQGRG